MGPLTLLGFAVKRALLFEGAELHELNALGLRLLVTCSRVITAFALGTLQDYQFTGHFSTLLFYKLVITHYPGPSFCGGPGLNSQLSG